MFRPIGLLCLVAIACDSTPDEGRPPSAQVVRLSEPAMLTLGDEAGGPQTFGRIAGVVVLGDSLVVVADQLAAELRFFRLDGTHVRTRGGRGDGPGEFSRPRLLGLGSADSLIVQDGNRIHLLDQKGEWGRSFLVLSEAQREPVQAVAALQDGTAVVQLINLSLGPLGDGDILTDTTRLALASPGRPLQLLGAVATPAWVLAGERRVPIPFAPTLTLTTWENRVISLTPDGSNVVVFGPTTSMAVWSSMPPESIADVDWEDEVRRLRDRGVTSEALEIASGLRGSEVVPQQQARYDLVVTSTTGEAWVRHSRGEPTHRTWDVFGPDGESLGGASTPRALVPYYISDDLMVGVLRGPLGTQSVVGYWLARD